MNKDIFIFYTINEKSDNRYWSYGKLPKGWWWVGGGSAGKDMYTNDEQFNGPAESKSKMIKYLETFFNKLKADKVIIRYKIRQSFLP